MSKTTAGDYPSKYVNRDVWPRVKDDSGAVDISRALQRLFTLSDFIKDPDPAVRYLVLDPNQDFRDRYYLRRPILCVLTNGPAFHYRDLERLHDVALKHPHLDGRVFFVISNDQRGAIQACAEDAKRTQRDYIVIDQRRLCDDIGDGYIHALLLNVLRVRNHFNEKDPVSSDSEFFARNALVDGLIGSLDSGRCGVVLGLRRIGKTSVLKRIVVMNARSQGSDFWTHYFDAHRIHTTGITAADTLLQVCRGIEQAWSDKHGRNLVRYGNIPSGLDLASASDFFDKFIKRFLAHSNRRLLLIIDDFQELVPNAFRESSWNRDYLGFASTLKSVHLEHQSSFVFLLASTNPNFIRQEFHDVQNPFLSSLDHRYVDLFSIRQLGEMLQDLGKPMGVTIAHDAIGEIHRLFGGHPFLSRQFCSILCERETRPITFTAKDVQATYAEKQGLLDNDFVTILENLRVIFPNEYRLVLEMARSGSQITTMQLPAMFRDNLVGYGIIDKNGRFRMSAMQTYLRRSIESNSFADLSETFEEIEAGLRQLIRFTYRSTEAAGAEAVILRRVFEALGDSIAEPDVHDATARLRLCRLPALSHIILSDWNVLGNALGDKNLLSECLAIYRQMHQPVNEGQRTTPSLNGADYTKLKQLRERVGT